MSLRIDSSEYFSGLVIGGTGLGVLAENIPPDGDNGPSFLYSDVSLPGDNGKEIRCQIVAWPSAGTLVVYEDGSFEFSGAPDGIYSFSYQLYVDGVAIGSPVTVSFSVGAVNGSASGVLATVTFTAPQATANGTSVVHGSAAGNLASITIFPPNATAMATANGDAVAFGALQAISLTVPMATATGTAAGGMTLTQGDINAVVSAVLAALHATAIPVDVHRVLTEPVPGSWPTAEQNAEVLLSRPWP